MKRLLTIFIVCFSVVVFFGSADTCFGQPDLPATTVSEGSSSIGGSPFGMAPVAPVAPIAPSIPVAPVHPPVAVAAPGPSDPPTPAVSVRVRVPAVSAPGKEICYLICVENCSSAAAHHVCVRASLPNNVEVVKSSHKPTHTKNEMAWGLGTMEPGACQTMKVVLRPLGGTDVKFCARIQYEHGQCVTTRLSGFAAEPVPGQPHPPGQVPQPPDIPPGKQPPVVTPPGKKPPTGKEPPIVPPPDKKTPIKKDPAKPSKLTLSMVGPKKQYVNLPTTYRITVRNEGVGPATNVAVTNDIPAQAEYISSTPNAVVHAGRAVWLLDGLQPGQSQSFEIVLRAKAEGKICNKASAIDDWQKEVNAEWCTVFQGISALMFEMVDTKDPIRVGDETSYTILVRNQGDQPVTNIRIRALIPKELQVTRGRGPTDSHRAKPTPDGHDVIEFDPLAKLEPGKQVQYELFAKGFAAGDARFAVEMIADQLTPGIPVREEESTHIYDENGQESKEPPQVKLGDASFDGGVEILPPVIGAGR